jgi:hypothetical protein
MGAAISGSVGLGGRNHVLDVKTVQGLLNKVPADRGGPAVSLAVDGLCYGKTLAAIENFQRKGCGFKWPDKRVDPGKRTWAELQRFDRPAGSNVISCFPGEGQHDTSPRIVQASFVSSAAAPAPVTAASLVSQARSSLPLASSWAAVTMRKLKRIRAMIVRFHVYTPDEIKFFGSIETHFKVRIPAIPDVESKARIDKLIDMYDRILQAFAQMGTGRLVGDPTVGHKALAPLGGFNDSKAVITIGSDFANSNPNMRAAVLIHEAAHFVDAACSHAASELPALHGSPITDSFGKMVNPSGKNYAQLDFALHLQNAYSFAQCALHNGLGVDKRPP